MLFCRRYHNIMNKFFVIAILFFGLVSCNNNNDANTFTVKGQIKNVPDQKIFLEQLYFGEKNPVVLDSATIKNGTFTLKGHADEEGLFRLKLENLPNGFLFINDKSPINFTADIKDVSIDGPQFESPANHGLKALLKEVDKRGKQMEASTMQYDSLSTKTGNDSVLSQLHTDLLLQRQSFSNFITRYIDTVSNPVLGMFTLGYSQSADPSVLKEIVPNLTKRFPNHKGIAEVTNLFNTALSSQSQQQKPNSKPGIPGIGDAAPDFTLNDENGKAISLSSFKGKYVLVDFWASWCGPCRAENPNVVAAYNKFKNKNFTILGVSLDENKDKWLKAIKSDNLAWQQVSDLKGWGNITVGLYGFDGIPYNVLIDPSGKIIATELRGSELHSFLEKTLK